MRFVATILLLASCSDSEAKEQKADSSSLEERVRGLELEMARLRDPPVGNNLPAVGAPPGMNSWWWCPTSGDNYCTPENHAYTKGMAPGEERAWASRAALYAVEACQRSAVQDGSGCAWTRSVVCATHDVGEPNVCYATWAGCLAHVKRRPERSCAAYFAGKRLK